ncbi:response regulator transcription factor [Dyadobacter sp. MSC1_007]|jgi:DNA-binding NarL/FixJ family response regulator|uniref:response regulator transcription factor n=1 Tax=Dyadobacter sp. MSC1_007 TaxID=2909264 RepID=UPI0020305F98|nr:response regulator transcription factor [Dyadobacter sp. MSC1_007]
MKILIIEDEPLTVLGLKQKIGEINPIALIEATPTVETALTLMDQNAFQLIILDIDIKGRAGASSVERLKARQPQTAVLIITDLDEEVYGLHYINAGADGFMSKLAPSARFDEAIRAMMVMGKYVSSNLQQMIIQEFQEQRSSRYVNPLMNISDREKQVMTFLIDGKSTSEIASMLNINRTTVGTHKMRILKKMQVSSLIKLIEKVTMLS